MTDCTHEPDAHPPPFWFADQLGPDDASHQPGRERWQAFLQVDGMVCPVEPKFLSEADCLDFIREQILPAGVCDG